jgi:hypothetical protein
MARFDLHIYSSRQNNYKHPGSALQSFFSLQRNYGNLYENAPFSLVFCTVYHLFFAFSKNFFIPNKTHTAFELHFKAVHFTKKTNLQPKNGIFLHFKVLVDFLHVCRCALPFLLHWPA